MAVWRMSCESENRRERHSLNGNEIAFCCWKQLQNLGVEHALAGLHCIRLFQALISDLWLKRMELLDCQLA